MIIFPGITQLFSRFLEIPRTPFQKSLSGVRTPYILHVFASQHDTM